MTRCSTGSFLPRSTLVRSDPIRSAGFRWGVGESLIVERPELPSEEIANRSWLGGLSGRRRPSIPAGTVSSSSRPGFPRFDAISPPF